MKPNFKIKVLFVEKRSEDDSYEQGCIGNERNRTLAHAEIYDSIEEAFQDIVGDRSITAKEVNTIDPNIYCDVKGGGARVEQDNERNGRYRCTYQREENSKGRKPTATEDADFKSGKINFRLADYEVRFQIVSVGLGEEALAEFLGVSNG